MPELHVLTTPEEAAQAAAGFVADLAEECVSRRGRFTIALSGGSTPHKLYRVLTTPPHCKTSAKVGHFWTGNQWRLLVGRASS